MFGQFLNVVPDLVAGILSPSTRGRDLTEKNDVDARNEVAEYWVIEPRAASITVLCRTANTFDAGTTSTMGSIPSRLRPDLEATVEQTLEH